MRALLINAVCGIRSTGRICTDLACELEAQGYEVKIAYGREEVPEQYQKYAIRIGNAFDVYWHALMSKVLDQRGLWSRAATKKFLKWADKYNPDLLWLHNIHDHFINIELLFEWIKKRPNMIVKWTQHDCWSFTGSCFHFTHSSCRQWQTACETCPSKALVANPPLIRTPRKNYKKKKQFFLGVKNMTLITPSNWLKSLINGSFLCDYNVIVHHNEIDETIFKPTKSDFREQYGLLDKRIILGVASAWNKQKGIDDFIRLSKMLNDDEVIVLVGLSSKQRKHIPADIIAIERTNSIKELAGIYSSANVFVNLTYEDTYPTVNLEAQACGTPCITYRTGGSPESVPAENVIEVGELGNVLVRIREICAKNQMVYK